MVRSSSFFRHYLVLTLVKDGTSPLVNRFKARENFPRTQTIEFAPTPRRGRDIEHTPGEVLSPQSIRKSTNPPHCHIHLLINAPYRPDRPHHRTDLHHPSNIHHPAHKHDASHRHNSTDRYLPPHRHHAHVSFPTHKASWIRRVPHASRDHLAFNQLVVP